MISSFEQETYYFKWKYLIRNNDLFVQYSIFVHSNFPKNILLRNVELEIYVAVWKLKIEKLLQR